MATRTISLSEDAYKIPRAEKKSRESFSDVVKRIAEKKSLSSFAGAWNRLGDEKIKKMSESLQLRDINPFRTGASCVRC